jgi:quercetin 2,3-dioxygenase
MKIILHKADTRGAADHGWLKAKHSFSFASWHNPERVHFGALRVLNDDFVAGGMGFGMHPHDNMEIVTIPMSGTLEHKDSLGNTGIIGKGEVQVMSAGTGVRHSEYNHSETEPVTLFQVWVFPNKKNVEPRYDQKYFDFDSIKNNFLTIVSPMADADGLHIHQDAWFSIGKIENGVTAIYNVKKKSNGVYLFVIEGDVTVNGEKLNRRDAIGITDTDIVEITADTNAELLVIDVPM